MAATKPGIILQSTALLPICYLAPVEYFALMLKYPAIRFEAHEHFVKQTFRSRCSIYGANGKLNLVIPIRHTGERTKMKNVKIAYAEPWQRNHWRSLATAYRSSPFFEFYEDDFAPFYLKKYDCLVDFNEALQNLVLKLLNIEITSSKTTGYKEEHPDADDYRSRMNPKSPVPSGKFIITPYAQVFSEKFGFFPNLSIADLLFNQGPDAVEYLKNLPGN